MTKNNTHHRSFGGNFTMSECINIRGNGAAIRWKLLTGVSALALAAYISSANIAKAEDADHPTLWMELGGQFDFLSDSAETWVPSNLPLPIDHPVTGVFNHSPRIGYDENGNITFQPTDSDWTFSASIRYGKAKHGPKSDHDQTYELNQKYRPITYAFADTRWVSETKHVILDFQAGKDMGLGFLGGHGISTLNLGIRMAHFTDNAHGTLTAQVSAPGKYKGGVTLDGDMHAVRSFTGLGPSIDWKASLPMTGSQADGITFDWGADAAILFGRQKTDITLRTKSVQYVVKQSIYSYVLSQTTSEPIRKKQVIVPNIGGFAGVSYRMHGDAKISFGYRADFYFNAIDGGIQTRKTENRAFFGPFASVSIGVGD